MLEFALGVLLLLAQQSTPPESAKPVAKPAEKPAEPEQQPVKEKRTELNLLGATVLPGGWRPAGSRERLRIHCRPGTVARRSPHSGWLAAIATRQRQR